MEQTSRLPWSKDAKIYLAQANSPASCLPPKCRTSCIPPNSRASCLPQATGQGAVLLENHTSRPAETYMAPTNNPASCFHPNPGQLPPISSHQHGQLSQNQQPGQLFPNQLPHSRQPDQLPLPTTGPPDAAYTSACS
ncbi:hypothetical protein DPMN_141327 [Dreissena polymorpha]|uniref:Uncharacterized protein n=1 Tax=Dreissena polymorpha TaxID=45954 RepID=A0A9D4JJT2_DREPO|nr:hypothetical protein DPMN_141327 [Dreissena polymorpha]